MIDSEFRVYLIEANTNPCLEASSPLLGRLIPAMVDNALKYSYILHSHTHMILRYAISFIYIILYYINIYNAHFFPLFKKCNPFRLAIDPVFPAPDALPPTKKIPPCDTLPENKFYLVFDEKIDEPLLQSYLSQYSKLNPPIVEMDEEQVSSSESDGETKEDVQ